MLLFLRRFARHVSGTVGAAILLLVILAAVFAPHLTRYDPSRPDYGAALQEPSAAHPFGTDDLGRDYMTRVIYGARTSLNAGLISVGLALLIGLPFGLISGYFRGFWDEIIIMRIVDALQAFPFLILALAIAAVLGPGLNKAMIAIGISFSPGFIRIVRGQVLAQREQDHVLAARAQGASDWRIIFQHVLPNSMGPVLVQASLAIAGAIIAEASLSYLGLGAQPPTPSWGQALTAAQSYLTLHPYLAIWPGGAIFVTVLAFNLLGDGLRDTTDPRLRGR